jgi:serine/threonine protein kinase
MARSIPARGSLVGKKYRLEDLVGEGAMGQVWAAENVLTERRVGLKLLRATDPESRARMLREARAAGRIIHRNVVEIFDAGETDDGAPFIVMPLLTGETLEAKLRREHALPNAEAVQVAMEMVSGLASAHAVGVVHRDLKPANVFLYEERGARRPTVKLLDFGISKILSEDDSFASGPVGSPAYMSPEQIRAEPFDARTDLWSLGVVVYETVTGSLPYEATDLPRLIHAVLEEPIRPLHERVPDTDGRLALLTSVCLRRDPAKRVRSATALLKLLKLDQATTSVGEKTVNDNTIAEDPPDTLQVHAVVSVSPDTSPEAFAETGRSPDLPSIFDTGEESKR